MVAVRSEFDLESGAASEAPRMDRGNAISNVAHRASFVMVGSTLTTRTVVAFLLFSNMLQGKTIA